jgi:hypothetical protein
MAKIQKRTWLGRGPTGHKVRKVAWGYTLQVGRKQERKFSAEVLPLISGPRAAKSSRPGGCRPSCHDHASRRRPP